MNRFPKRLISWLDWRFFGLALLSAQALAAPSLDQIKEYGVYAKGSQQYVKVSALNHLELDYPWYREIPFVERANSQLELVIFAKDFKANEVSFELSPMSNHAVKNAVMGHISPLAKANLYQVTFTGDVPAENVLMVYQGTWFNGQTGVIALGKPETSLTKALADKSVPVYARYPSLEQLLKVYPQHAGLKALFEQTKTEMAAYEDDKAFGYVSDYYKNGLQPEKFEQAAGELRGYLQRFPTGLHADDAKAKLAAIESRLKDANKPL